MNKNPDLSAGGTFHYDTKDNLLKHESPTKPRSGAQEMPAAPKADKPAAAVKKPVAKRKPQPKAAATSAKPAASPAPVPTAVVAADATA